MLAKVAISLVVEVILFAALLFGGAGTWRWPEAWLFLFLFAAGASAQCLWLARHDPALLAERMKMRRQKEQPFWDRIFLLLLVPLFFIWLGVMGLDSVRFHLVRLPLWLEALGLVGTLLSFWGLFAVFRTNTFLAPVVKIQAERGQRVIDTGPYALVRHPMYAFAGLYLLATALLLGSVFGLVAGLLLTGAFAVRIPLEERVLLAGLAGYDDYRRRVRWRLLPGVW
jgi:protein-S-isoprenylcysteine O-methyltransferase Ste14